jgi:hypothetical protein
MSVQTAAYIEYWCDAIENGTDSMCWGDIANLDHETQVGIFGFCTCEQQEETGYRPYSDCPTEGPYHA